MRPTWRKTAIALFVVTLLTGGLFGDRLLALNDDAREVLRLYTELLTAARESYAGEVSYRQLVNASIEGMVRTLDPHTSFLSADAYSTMRDRQQSSFFGLGILVGMRNGRLTVITPIEGTPASRVGLRAGDVISEIEHEPTEGMNINEAVSRLKGPKGTKVNITIVRPGLEEPLEVSITRDRIPQNSVRYAYMISPDTAYVNISDFNRGTGAEVEGALRRLREEGMERLLLDLRNNGGGLLDQAIEVAEQFVPAGAAIVETRGRTRDSFQEFRATERSTAHELPLIVLVNEGTASAAEILAGAIQDHDVGLIVGVPTWGKGLVQTVYSLSYGAGLALTTAKYYTPSGRLIQRDYTSFYDYATYANGGTVEEPEAPGAVTEAFSTDLGRKVYGGGGIAPDVIVEPEELAPYVQYLLSRNAFFDFAVAYRNRRSVTEAPIESPAWSPPTDVLEQFAAWVVDEGLSTREEVENGLAEPLDQEVARRQIRAEVLNAAFGLEARYRALADGDHQIRRALELFGEASELLVRRHEVVDDADRPPAGGVLR